MTNQAKFKSAIATLDFIGNNPSFDIGEFLDRISKGEDWAKLMVAHIYLDHIVTEGLSDHLDHPRLYLNGHKSFPEKLNLCQAMGYFRKEFVVVLNAINKLRNRFAHKLVFDVTDDEKRDLFRRLTTERPISDITRPTGFEDFLVTVVMYAQVERAGEKRLRENRKKEEELKEKIYKIVSKI